MLESNSTVANRQTSRLNKGLVAVLAGLLLVWGTAAQDEGIKIGIVDIEQALNATEEGKAAREEMARKQREAESKLQPMVEHFEELQEEFKAKKFVLSEDALYQKQLDLVELRSEIDNKLKEVEGKFKVDKERLEGPLRKKLIGIIDNVGKEQGFTLILGRQTPWLLYSREAADITDIVIAKFNKKG